MKAPLIKHGYQLSLAELNKTRRFVEEEDSNEENPLNALAGAKDGHSELYYPDTAARITRLVG